MDTIDLVLADDHPIVLDGLEQLFRMEPDISVRARCTTGEETLEALHLFGPTIVVLDVRMPNGDGLAVLRAIRERALATRALLLTASLSDEQLVEALRLGAHGVVLKETAPQLLTQAVRTVANGGQWLEHGLGARAVRKLIAREKGLDEARQKLTARELDIVRMVARGHRNRVIADSLSISEGTVKVHLHNIYEKLHIEGRLGLAVYAQTNGLV